ncbi:uncharacterized protein LOC112883820 [Panicum hallii]|uniref:uncharacterized protein LOC112883820 n=1 Tax=Panicum hallii TaxID=206008 RepID=UPI000DF4E8EC|nr:uncharacterized protein LOC112883820 [Panicum hallii]
MRGAEHRLRLRTDRSVGSPRPTLRALRPGSGEWRGEEPRLWNGDGAAGQWSANGRCEGNVAQAQPQRTWLGTASEARYRIRLTDAGCNFVGHHMPPPPQHSRRRRPPVFLLLSIYGGVTRRHGW